MTNNSIYNFFCINLKRRQDRWQRMQAITQTADIDLVHIEAVDAQNPQNQQKIQSMRYRGPTGIMGSGPIACTLSHAKAWKYFLESDFEYGVFIEDDVILCDDINSIIYDFLSKKPPFDLIKIECGGSALKGLLLGKVEAEIKGRKLRACYQLATDSAGYIFSRAGAFKALSEIKNCNVGVDHFLFYPIKRTGGAGISFAIIEPTLVIQDRDLYSDINSTRYNDNVTIRRLKRTYYEIAPAFHMATEFIKGARVIKAPFMKSTNNQPDS